MQDQYFGDVGDYAKYGLLRHLVGAGVSLAVNWYLVPDTEGNEGDGRHVGYLDQPEHYRHLDPELFHFLKAEVGSGRRHVRRLEESGLVRASYFASPLDFYAGCSPSDRQQRRATWHADALAATAGATVVFLDPDNGLEGGVAIGSRQGMKYVYYDELADYYGREQSLLIYHHLGRAGSHAEQVARRCRDLGSRFEGAEIRPLCSRRGTARVFFLVMRLDHRRVERGVSEFCRSAWVSGRKHRRVFEPLE